MSTIISLGVSQYPLLELLISRKELNFKSLFLGENNLKLFSVVFTDIQESPIARLLVFKPAYRDTQFFKS